VAKRTESSGLGSLASAALTAGSTFLVAAFAAAVGVLIAREFGRTDETDGFFAAYGVFFVPPSPAAGRKACSPARSPGTPARSPSSRFRCSS
jgi:hypothetical protein